jgi:hypothetical protein
VIIFTALVGTFGALSGAYFLLAGGARNTATAGSFVRVSASYLSCILFTKS